MHELAIAQALVGQIEAIARERAAQSVPLVVIGVGPLSGIEAQSLKNAYPLATAGTVAEGSELRIESIPVRVHCQSCEKASDTSPNHLVCRHCGDWKTQLLSGDELLLVSLELEKIERNESCATPAVAT